MLASSWTIGGFAAAASFAWLMCKARTELQGYFWDRHCTNSKLLKNKVAVITGANSGLGLALAKLLVERGAHVIMACRSMSRSQPSLKEVEKAAKNGGKAELMVLDLNSPKSIDSFASEFLAKGLRLHYLVCNAGIFGPGKGENKTAENGVAKAFQSNHLGHFQLVNLLTKKLQENAKTEDTRVISVSSGAHFRGTIAWEDVSAVDSWAAYCQSKLAQVMHMKELQRRFEAAGCRPEKFKAVSTTPGAVRTNIFNSPILSILLFPLIWFMCRNTRTGAQVMLHCIVEDSITPGGFYSNLYEKPARGKNGIANDVSAQARLWTLSEELLKKSL